ncbi:unnamed protein product [Linum trigynum]|uniref:Leucine-rich repeat-containing N-terminal plant-type domain-containing protein n=1 Tax=Linum trigynum TaxID=586398 RepID=A0AAV2F1P3_9ROSI
MQKFKFSVVVVVTISHLLTLQQCCHAHAPQYHPPSPTSNWCRHDESDALVQFKNSFTIIGDGHDRATSWKGGVDCCLWEGVTCDPLTGHVTGLDLSCAQVADLPYHIPQYSLLLDSISYTAKCHRLQGTLQANNSIAHLRFLRSLNLAHNDFHDSIIPYSFTKLTSLSHLNLSNTKLAGRIPSGFNHLDKLVLLDLSFNHVSFGKPEDYSKLLANATKLSELWLQRVNMSDIKPSSFSNLSRSLKYLDFSSCGLVRSFKRLSSACQNSN